MAFAKHIQFEVGLFRCFLLCALVHSFSFRLKSHHFPGACRVLYRFTIVCSGETGRHPYLLFWRLLVGMDQIGVSKKIEQSNPPVVTSIRHKRETPRPKYTRIRRTVNWIFLRLIRLYLSLVILRLLCFELNVTEVSLLKTSQYFVVFLYLNFRAHIC